MYKYIYAYNMQIYAKICIKHAQNMQKQICKKCAEMCKKYGLNMD